MVDATPRGVRVRMLGRVDRIGAWLHAQLELVVGAVVARLNRAAGLAFARRRACWPCLVRRDRRSKLSARLVRSGQAARPGAPSGVRSFRGPLGYPKVKTYASTPASRNATSNVRSVIDPCSRTS